MRYCPRWSATLKGAALGGVFPLVCLWVVIFPEVIVPFAIVGGLCIAVGTAMGALAGRIQQKRRLRLSLFAVGFLWCASTVLALLMILPEQNFPADYTTADVWTGAFMLGLSGVLIFAPFFLPVMLGATFILERWTRADAAHDRSKQPA